MIALDTTSRKDIRNSLAIDLLLHQYLGGDEIISEGLKILERPDHLLISRDLDQLWILRSGVRVSKDEVAIRKHLERRYPGQGDSWKFLLVDTPDNLAFAGNLENAIVVPAGDQRIAVLQPNRAKDARAVTFWTMAR